MKTHHKRMLVSFQNVVFTVSFSILRCFWIAEGSHSNQLILAWRSLSMRHYWNASKDLGTCMIWFFSLLAQPAECSGIFQRFSFRCLSRRFWTQTRASEWLQEEQKYTIITTWTKQTQWMTCILRIRLSMPTILNVFRVSMATIPVWPTKDGLHEHSTVIFAPCKSDLTNVLLKWS